MNSTAANDPIATLLIHIVLSYAFALSALKINSLSNSGLLSSQQQLAWFIMKITDNYWPQGCSVNWGKKWNNVEVSLCILTRLHSSSQLMQTKQFMFFAVFFWFYLLVFHPFCIVFTLQLFSVCFFFFLRLTGNEDFKLTLARNQFYNICGISVNAFVPLDEHL